MAQRFYSGFPFKAKNGISATPKKPNPIDKSLGVDSPFFSASSFQTPAFFFKRFGGGFPERRIPDFRMGTDLTGNPVVLLVLSRE